jgi:hypothetical protein
LPETIHKWADIQEEFKGAIFLGNGASIAVDEEFSYESLVEYAKGVGLLTPDVERIFEFFGTEDFELILRAVWQATNVNQTLGINGDKTALAYLHVRSCLIQVVRAIHPTHEEVIEHLACIYRFLQRFGVDMSYVAIPPEPA